MDAAKKEKVIEMYNEGFSVSLIAKTVEETRDTIGSWLRKQKKKGTIQARESTVYVKEQRTKDLSHDDVITKMYNENKKLREIAAVIGKSESFVDLRIKDLRAQGLLIKRKRVSEVKKETQPRPQPQPTVKRVYDLSFEIHEPIEVTPAICIHCIYGRPNDSMTKGLCRFIDCTGVARITLMPLQEIGYPKMENRKIKCNVYSKITPSNPRRRTIMDDINTCSIKKP